MTLKQFYKFKKKIILFAALCAANFFCFIATRAQEVEAKIKITSHAFSSAQVHVSGKFRDPKSKVASRDLSFLQIYADVSDLGARIENLTVFDEAGEKLEVKKFMDGEFQADKRAVAFDYVVKT
jgi:hypothetical protein